MYVCFRKSKLCWQWAVSQAKSQMKTMSPWTPTRHHDNPAALRSQLKSQITCQWPLGPSIFLHLGCKSPLPLIWASGPAQRPLPGGQFLSLTVNHPQWIGTSSRTEKVRGMWQVEGEGRAGGVQLGLPVTIPKHGASGGQSEVVIQPGSYVQKSRYLWMNGISRSPQTKIEVTS